jgi:hypothetical protein
MWRNFLYTLFCGPYIEVVKARLPEGTPGFSWKQFALARIFLRLNRPIFKSSRSLHGECCRSGVLQAS